MTFEHQGNKFIIWENKQFEDLCSIGNFSQESE